MRRSLALMFLFLAGCGPAIQADLEAAKERVRKSYSASHITRQFDLVEGPEYADIPRIPRDDLAPSAADRAAACGVRVKFTYRYDNTTVKDDWVVWVSNEHKAVGWSGNPSGDNWRQFV